MLKQPIKECNLIDLSEKKFLNCFYTNATLLNNIFDEFIEEIHSNEGKLL
jgi:hypothetical protein